MKFKFHYSFLTAAILTPDGYSEAWNLKLELPLTRSAIAVCLRRSREDDFRLGAVLPTSLFRDAETPVSVKFLNVDLIRLLDYGYWEKTPARKRHFFSTEKWWNNGAIVIVLNSVDEFFNYPYQRRVKIPLGSGLRNAIAVISNLDMTQQRHYNTNLTSPFTQTVKLTDIYI